MAPDNEFEMRLHEVLSSMTPLDEADAAHECPEPQAIACHVRGTRTDEEVAKHISSCDRCAEFANDVRRRQKLYERQKLAFTQLAQQKYPSVPILKETFQPFAWMLKWKALVPELALVIVVVAVAFNYRSPSPPTEGHVTFPSETNSAASTIMQIENSDPRRPADSAVLLEKFQKEPDLVRQVDATRVAQARLVVNQKRAAVANDPKLADQWSNIEGKLQGYEFIAHYNSLRKQADGSVMLGKVAGIEGKNGSVVISFDHDPITDSQDSKLLSTSAVETPGLNQVIILTPQRRWRLDASNDFEVVASVDSPRVQKPRE